MSGYTGRLARAAIAAIGLVLVTAVPAFAGSELPPPGNDVAGIVVHPPGAHAGAAGGNALGGIAFTGGNVRMWMVLVAGLLVVGTAFLIAGRRRRANAAS